MLRRAFFLIWVFAIAQSAIASDADPSAKAANVQGRAAGAKCANVPIALELGLLRRTFDAVERNNDCWVESICTAVSKFNQREYDRFVQLVREESSPLNDMERQKRPRDARHFLQYSAHENRERAFQCLEQKGENSSSDAQFALYLVIQTSPQRPPISPIKWLKKAADGGVPMAQYRVSEQILNYYNAPDKAPPEFAGELSIQKYREWLSKAAEAGLPEAQYVLGGFYRGAHSNFGSYSADVASAVEWYKRAAAQSMDRRVRNNALAQLGHLYYLGKLMPQDYKEAFRWYSQVDPQEIWQPCANPLVVVRSALRNMYRDGLGVPKDVEKAKELSKVSFACV